MRCRAAAATITLLALGCFETPVRESLEIRILPSGRAALTATVEIAEVLRGEDAARRAADMRGDLLREQDAWSRRFERLEAESETYRRVHSHGTLVQVERSAIVPFGELSRLFADTGVSALITGDGAEDEIALHPFASSRATRQQETEARRALGAFAGALETYHGSVHELYRHLEANPHRAAAAFGALFQVDTEAETRLSPLEANLVRAVDASMSAALETVTATASGLPADELATLVYDPFPAEIRMVVPGVTEHQGFVPKGGEIWVIERKSFSAALVSLAGMWASPDPLVLLLTSSEEENRDLELEDVVAMPRRSSAPASPAIRRALEESLRPAPAYRLRWKTLP